MCILPTSLTKSAVFFHPAFVYTPNMVSVSQHFRRFASGRVGSGAAPQWFRDELHVPNTADFVSEVGKMHILLTLYQCGVSADGEKTVTGLCTTCQIKVEAYRFGV